MAVDIRRRAERDANELRREAAEWASATRRDAERYRDRLLAQFEHDHGLLGPADHGRETDREVPPADPEIRPVEAPAAIAVAEIPAQKSPADESPADDVEIIDVTVAEPQGEVIDLRSAAEARGTPMAPQDEPSSEPPNEPSDVPLPSFTPPEVWVRAFESREDEPSGEEETERPVTMWQGPSSLQTPDDWPPVKEVAPRVVRRRSAEPTRESSELADPASQLLLSELRRTVPQHVEDDVDEPARPTDQGPAQLTDQGVDDEGDEQQVDETAEETVEVERQAGAAGSYVLGHPLPPVQTSIESKVHDVVRLAVRRTFHAHYP